MAVASEDQRKKLTPVTEYFDRKHHQREEKDIWDRRFIASVLEVIRADDEDQTQWAERRRHRRLAACHKQSCLKSGGSPRSAHGGAESAMTPLVQLPKEGPYEVRRKNRLVKSRREAPNHNSESSRSGGETIDVTMAMTKIGQLKSSLSKAPDPPAIALDMGNLYLVLSDRRSALKSFRLAVKPSPEWTPTKQQQDRMEAQKRKLMILSEDRRAEGLAALHAQESEKRRRREEAERTRIRRAATGIFLCLLELKQPVEAANAAKLRLDMCETEDERRQAEAEIHAELLKRNGLLLLEPEATNQGAWLTESAGALSDLHASVLESLTGFTHDDDNDDDDADCPRFQQASPATAARSLGHQDFGRTSPQWAKYWDSMDAQRPRLQGVNNNNNNRNSNSCSWAEGGDGCSSTDGGYCVMNKLKPGGDDGRAAIGRGKKKSVASCGVQGETNRRRLLHELGRLLARKRQFTASRKAFDEAMRGGQDETLLRERNKCRSRGYFVDMALTEAATPSIQLKLDTRWQGGVGTDEARRRALRDLTGFTGVHRGAETLVAAVPAGGWATGASELGYAERFSRAREAVSPLQGGGTTKNGTAVAVTARSRQQDTGILLGYKVTGDEVAQS